MRVVAVSGGFDPIHAGHIRYIKEAKKFGDKLVVILNNDNWLRMKKGFVFMPEHERAEVLAALKEVDEVVLTKHTPDTSDYSVCEALRAVRPDIFCNGGDRTHDNIPEVPVCNEIGAEMVFGVGQGGKVQSSSWLLEGHKRHALGEYERSLRTAVQSIGDSSSVGWHKKILTMCLVMDGARVLLGMKKRGFGAGKWNGFGGKVEGGESIRDAAMRELSEEAGITARASEEVGVLRFFYEHERLEMEVFVFRITEYEGEPAESEEMRPQWFDADAVPFDSMWLDDPHWLPAVLGGKKVHAIFRFTDYDTLQHWHVDEV